MRHIFKCMHWYHKLSDRCGKNLTFILEMYAHDDVLKCRKHFPRYWPFVRGIHRWPVNSPHKGQWRGAFMFSLIDAWTNDWINDHNAGNLRRHRAHYDVIVIMILDMYEIETSYLDWWGHCVYFRCSISHVIAERGPTSQYQGNCLVTH